ncbi:MAG: hypothetical protein KF842_05905 [Caulobacter sp.]|nr:hypothetical protein [Caulobacter sp.]
MRPGLILLLLALPGAAMATEDRYGPRRASELTVAGSATRPQAYGGPTLTWSGKAQASVPDARRSVAAAPTAPVRSPPAYADRGAAPAPAPPASLPTSLYDGPAAPAQAAPPSPPVAASPYGNYQPRAYSVVREYGGTPDRIPAPPPQSAFTGPEVSLMPGLLGAAPPDDPAGDADTEDPEARRPAKDKK